jgi:hypothetical protein
LIGCGYNYGVFKCHHLQRIQFRFQNFRFRSWYWPSTLVFHGKNNSITFNPRRSFLPCLEKRCCWYKRNNYHFKNYKAILFVKMARRTVLMTIIVNAGFLYKICPSAQSLCPWQPTIGGIPCAFRVKPRLKDLNKHWMTGYKTFFCIYVFGR